MSALPISPIALSLENAIDPNPLTVSPQTLVLEAIALMHQESDRCNLSESPPSQSEPVDMTQLFKKLDVSSLLVVEQGELVGLLTERDLVRLAARGIDLATIVVAEVMTGQVITAKNSELHDIFHVLSLFRQYRIRHLPILNETGELVGMLSLDGMREALQAAYLLKLRRVAEIMTPDVIYTTPSASLRKVVQLMNDHQISSVVICESEPTTNQPTPVGIITEKDIVQFHALQLNLDRLTAKMVMSTPVWSVGPEDSLWVVHQKMYSLRIRHLVVCQPLDTATSRFWRRRHPSSGKSKAPSSIASGPLLGMVTQGSLMQVVDPNEMLSMIHLLQRQVSEIEQEKIQLLNNCKTFLEQQVENRTAQIQEQADYQRLLATVAQRIRQSLNLEEILTTTVKEVRQILACDRVSIYQCNGSGADGLMAASVQSDLDASLVSTICNSCRLLTGFSGNYRNGIRAIDDIYNAGLYPSEISAWEELGFRASLLVPIIKAKTEDRYSEDITGENTQVDNSPDSPEYWGFLIAGECDSSRDWQPSQIELLEQLAVQLAIAIQQSTLLSQARSELEERLQAEQALAQQHNFASAILDVIGALVVVLDCHGKILKFNQACEQTTGYRFEEVVGQSIWNLLLLPEEVEGVRTTVNSLAAGKFPNQYQNYWLTKNRQRRLITWSNTCLTNEKGEVEYVIATGIDITERHQAETSLQDLLKRYKTLIKAAPVGIFLTDIQGQCLYVNEIWSQIAGMTESEALGNGWVQAIYPGDRSWLFAAWQETVQTQKMFRLEYRFQRPDGQITWVFGQAVPDIDRHDQVIGYLGTITDITQRKQAEISLKILNEELELRVEQRTAALQQLNQELEKEIRDRQQAETELQRLLSAVEAASDGIGILTDEKYRYLNQAHVKLFGYDRERELLGKSWRELYSTDEQERLRQNIFPVLKQQQYWRGEAIAQRKDGSRFAEELSLTLTHNGDLICVCQNIERRKQMEKALRSSEARFRAIFEQAAVGIALLTLDGNFLKVNQKFPKILGYRADEILSKNVFDPIYIDDVQQIRDSLQSLLQGQMETFSMENRCCRKNHTLVWVNMTISLIADSSGKPDYFLSVVEDISDRKQSEAQLQKVLQELAYHKQALDAFAIVTITDPKGTISYVNDKFCEISGYSQAEAIGQTHKIVNSGYHPASFFKQLWSTISQGKIWQGEIKNKNKSGQDYWVDTTIVPFLSDLVPPLKKGVKGKPGKPFQYLAIRIDITERKQAEEKIEQRESQLTAQYKGIPVPTYTWQKVEDDFILIDYNHAGEMTTQGQIHSFLGIKLTQMYQNHPNIIADFWECFQTQQTLEREYWYQMQSFNQKKYLIVHYVFVPPDLIMVHTQDLTERKQAEALLKASIAEKEVLLKEIHHRVKNNLQVIYSLLDLQSQYIEDPELLSQFEDSQNRIQSMALIHEKLYQSNDLAKINFTDYVESLVDHLFLSYGLARIQVQPILNISPLTLNLDTAIPCGLIITELVSNALKHGFPQGVPGEISVEIYPESDSDHFVVVISDNGIGFPVDLDFQSAESSLGLQLVCTLTQQLRGKIELDRSQGTKFKLTLSQIKKTKP